MYFHFRNNIKNRGQQISERSKSFEILIHQVIVNHECRRQSNVEILIKITMGHKVRCS